MPSPIIVDLSHHNQHVDFGKLKAAGIVGVVLKATQGTSYVDPSFKDFRSRAQSVFGQNMVKAYHFLTNEDPQAQAEHAMDTAANSFLFLDYEENPNGPTCTLETALAVCHAIQAQVGWPGMYGSNLLADAITAGHFGPCPLWGARYGVNPPSFLVDGLWQYDDQGRIAGYTGLDLNCFVGSADPDWFASL